MTPPLALRSSLLSLEAALYSGTNPSQVRAHETGFTEVYHSSLSYPFPKQSVSIRPGEGDTEAVINLVRDEFWAVHEDDPSSTATLRGATTSSESLFRAALNL
jgi:hypothetical protein